VRQVLEQPARRRRVVEVHPELDRAGHRAVSDRSLQAFVLGEVLDPLASSSDFATATIATLIVSNTQTNSESPRLVIADIKGRESDPTG
jgi:hypothetical protein